MLSVCSTAPIPAQARLGPDQFLQAVSAFLGTPFLSCADARVEHNHPEDERRVLVILKQNGDRAGRDQDVDQRADDLVQDDLNQRGRFAGRKHVVAIGFQPMMRFFRAESLNCCVEVVKDSFFRQGVPWSILPCDSRWGCRHIHHILPSAVQCRSRGRCPRARQSYGFDAAPDRCGASDLCCGQALRLAFRHAVLACNRRI